MNGLTVASKRGLRALVVACVVLIFGVTGALLAGQVAARPADVAPSSGAAGSFASGSAGRLPAGTPTSTPPCGLVWHEIDSPNPAPGPDVLMAVTAIAPNDVWAVGYNGTPYATAQTFATHWDGTTWSTPSTPNVGSLPNMLYAVAGASHNDVWAAGVAGNDPLMLHWDGSSWTVSTLPAVQTQSQLSSLAVVNSGDVWAVGNNASHTLTMHWNGSQWTIVPSPSLGTWTNSLRGVSALSSTDIWAVGMSGAMATPQPLTIHWDGVAWAVVSTPMPPGEYQPYALNSVAAIASNDVWAVGVTRNSSWSRTLVQHWDGSAWTIVDSPNGNTTGDNELLSMVAPASDDVWAVGWYLDNGGSGYDKTLVLHWDGTQWARVMGLEEEIEDHRLMGVAALGPSNLVAVGAQGAWAQQQLSTLVKRYNDRCATPSPTRTGTPPTVTSTPTEVPTPPCSLGWSVAASPNVGTGNNRLLSVRASSWSNAWAVGYYVDGGGVEHPLAMRWDGSGWSYVATPAVGTGNSRLNGLAVLSPTDAWAVGYSTNAGGVQRSLAMHWEGSEWSVSSTPTFGTARNRLTAVTAIQTNDVWAVGLGGDTGAYTLAMHWDGLQWTIFNTPSPGGPYGNELLSVDGRASNDVWAVGYWANGQYGDTLVLHWNGTSWARVASPSPGSQYEDMLNGITAVSANDAWAVGYYRFNNIVLTLILHWDGSAWTQVVTPNPGSDQNRLNAVSAGAGNDVWAVGSFLSNGVTQTLAMHWSGSGWGVAESPSPGSGANALNGVSAVGGGLWAAGYTQGTGGVVEQTLVERYMGSCASPTPGPSPTVCPPGVYTDVPPGSTFYPYVTCLFNRGIVSGYSDCTFRPSNNVTRGQIAKMVSNSANFQDDVTGRQTYSDVPSTNTFWLWIERLSLHGVMGGYQCGGPNEPCDPQNRPYFRWANNATRGQLAKIVSNSAGYNEEPSGQMFADVPPSHAFYAWIQRLASRGIIGGYQCGGAGEPCDPQNRPYFRPFNNVTRGQASKIVANAFFPECQAPCVPSWRVVPGPNGVDTRYLLQDVAVAGPDDVWAVGWGGAVGTPSGALIEHWNGTEWSIVDVPDPGTDGRQLYGVAAIAANDVWAVGFGATSAGDHYTLMLHWDGTAWGQVSSPNPPGAAGYLYSVDGIASNDVWAVGASQPDAGFDPMAMHWDGTSWTLATLPNYGSDLRGVEVLASNNAWAVGTGPDQTSLIVHWDGTQWSLSGTTQPVPLRSISAVSANDIWAAGSRWYSASTMILHWNGLAWIETPMQGPPFATIVNIDGISASAANDVWAVGWAGTQGDVSTLILHWNGSAWSITSSPNVEPPGDNHLYAVAAHGDTDTWAVGDADQLQALTLRYARACGTPTPGAVRVP